MAQALRHTGTFAAMAVHVGKLLRELYLHTGLKMERFVEGVPFSSKGIYYHFGKSTLNTSILEKYESGLKKLGIEIDIYDLMSRVKRGEPFEEAIQPHGHSTVSEPQAHYGKVPTKEEQVAQLLREAADLMDKPATAPAPDRDKGT